MTQLIDKTQTKQTYWDCQSTSKSSLDSRNSGIFYVRMHKLVGGCYQDMSAEGIYVGSALDCSVRLKSIKSSLSTGKSPYLRLQAKFDQYQRDSNVIVSLVGLDNVKINDCGESRFLEDDFDGRTTLNRLQEYWVGQMLKRGQTLLNDRLGADTLKVRLKMEALDSLSVGFTLN